MADKTDLIQINVGNIPYEELANIVREVRYLWRYVEDIWPQGDSKQAATIKATKNKHGEYSIWINHQGLKFLMLFIKNIPKDTFQSQVTQKEKKCPPEVPALLRWGIPEGSKPV